MKNSLSVNEKRVIEYLQKGFDITTSIAVIKFRIMNVQDVLMRLRRYGYNIQDKWIPTIQSRYKVYFLVPKPTDNLKTVSNKVKP